MVSPSPGSGPAPRGKPDLHLLPGRFFFYFKLSLACGLVVASPIIFSQIWRFVAPGLYRHEKRLLIPFAALSTLCFAGGAVFGYFVLFPPVFRFLIGYSNAFIEAMPSVGEYFSLALRLFFAFGLIFELPVFMVFLGRMGVVTPSWLRKNRKYALLVSLVAAALLTPSPDVVSQLLLAVPLMALYEISIAAVALFCRGTAHSGVENSAGQEEDDGDVS